MEEDVGYRTVQSAGRGSFIISLPKKWVQEIGIGKGSQIAIKILEDMSLILVPRKIEEDKMKKGGGRSGEYYIEVNQKSDPGSLCRRLISLYAASSEIIHLSFVGLEDNKELRAAVANLAKNLLLGTEVIEETSEKMTLQVLINHPELPIDKAIKRMANLSLSAHKDAIAALGDLNKDFKHGIYEAKTDVDRMNLYVVRQLKFGIKHNLFRDWGFKTSKEFLGYRLVANDIKNIAENALTIGRNMETLRRLIDDKLLVLKELVDEEAYSQIENFSSLAEQLFKESLESLFNRDYEQADRIISRTESFLVLENDLITLMLNKKMDPNLLSIYRLVLDNSRRIVEYSREIAEVTLNRTVEETSSSTPSG
jgi:phosphate uptake regulator